MVTFMDKISHYKRFIRMLFAFSVIIFLLEVLLIRGYVTEPANLSKIEVTLLFLPPFIGGISILILTYIRWIHMKGKGQFLKLLNGFIVFLTFCITILIVTLYISLVF